MKKYCKSDLTFGDLGIKDKRKKLSNDVIAKMKELRMQGLSYQKIANQLNINWMTVYLKLNPEYYKKTLKRNAEWARKNKKVYKESVKRYNERRKQILESIDVTKYLAVRKTVKYRLQHDLELNKEYTFKEVTDILKVKNTSYYYNSLKRLIKENIFIIKDKKVIIRIR